MSQSDKDSGSEKGGAGKGGVFSREWARVESVDSLLASGESDPAILREALSELVGDYRALVKQSDRLTRFADRSEAKWRDTNADLKTARAKLVEQAQVLEDSVKLRGEELAMERAKLAKLVEQGIALSAETDLGALMNRLISGAMELTQADGGTLYLTTEDGAALRFVIIHNRSLNIHMGETEDRPVPFPPVPLRGPDGEPNQANVVSHAVLREETVSIPDAYESEDFDFSGTRAFDQGNGYRSQSFLTVPLKPRGEAVIGALQLINAQDETGATIPFSEEFIGFVEALAALGATAIANRDLVDSQAELLDGFIKLIAGAIDAKSPYTGGHCERVPILAEMLARAATDSDAPPFADFAFTTDNEWREFHIAAWLHDCGKVTTPEFVVDKATKLETIHNRIHEIRTRFEVLLRDAEIDALRARLEGQAEDAVEARLAETQAALVEDFRFVAECNVGGEFLSDEHIARLETIAGRTWRRHLDNRLGLSHLELQRMAAVAPEPPSLPVEEPVLADRPEQVIPRPGGAAVFGENPHGFRMEVPKDLYNFGELHNLRIRRGTLTDEDRFKINDHIIQTIDMLGKLKFPKQLRRVPEYAGSHHETMIGTGYPRKLSRDDMSLPARIMAIADIFEALTASDRPYKKAKPLSEALKIMGFMVKDQHIDPDLFELFLSSGICQDYAERYLSPEQIDTV